MLRTIRPYLPAFLLAPLATPALYVLGLYASLWIDAVRRGGHGPDAAGVLAALAVAYYAGAPVAFGATLLGGTAWLLAFRGRGRRSRLVLLTIGVLLGTGIALVMAPHLRGELFSIPLPWWAGALLGAVTAEVFWRLLPPAITQRAVPQDGWRPS